MTSFIAAGRSGGPNSVIPAVPAASSVTTIAFIPSLPMKWPAQYLARRAHDRYGLHDRPNLTSTGRGEHRVNSRARRGLLLSPASRTEPPPPATAGFPCKGAALIDGLLAQPSAALTGR